MQWDYLHWIEDNRYPLFALGHWHLLPSFTPPPKLLILSSPHLKCSSSSHKVGSSSLIVNASNFEDKKEEEVGRWGGDQAKTTIWRLEVKYRTFVTIKYIQRNILMERVGDWIMIVLTEILERARRGWKCHKTISMWLKQYQLTKSNVNAKTMSIFN